MKRVTLALFPSLSRSLLRSSSNFNPRGREATHSSSCYTDSATPCESAECIYQSTRIHTFRVQRALSNTRLDYETGSPWILLFPSGGAPSWRSRSCWLLVKKRKGFARLSNLYFHFIPFPPPPPLFFIRWSLVSKIICCRLIIILCLGYVHVGNRRTERDLNSARVADKQSRLDVEDLRRVKFLFISQRNKTVARLALSYPSARPSMPLVPAFPVCEFSCQNVSFLRTKPAESQGSFVWIFRERQSVGNTDRFDLIIKRNPCDRAYFLYTFEDNGINLSGFE